MNKKITTKRIAFVGVLSAVYVLLSLISVGTNDFKISIESMAVLVAALVFGPVDGALVGIVGELIHQMLMYGIDATTVLWIMPYAAEGLVAGMIAEKRTAPVSAKSLAPSIIVGEVVLLLVVTPVNAVSAIIQGWGNWVTILGSIPIRLIITVVRIVAYIFVLPLIVRPLSQKIKQ